MLNSNRGQRIDEEIKRLNAPKNKTANKKRLISGAISGIVVALLVGAFYYIKRDQPKDRDYTNNDNDQKQVIDNDDKKNEELSDEQHNDEYCMPSDQLGLGQAYTPKGPKSLAIYKDKYTGDFIAAVESYLEPEEIAESYILITEYRGTKESELTDNTGEFCLIYEPCLCGFNYILYNIQTNEARRILINPKKLNAKMQNFYDSDRFNMAHLLNDEGILGLAISGDRGSVYFSFKKGEYIIDVDQELHFLEYINIQYFQRKALMYKLIGDDGDYEYYVVSLDNGKVIAKYEGKDTSEISLYLEGNNKGWYFIKSFNEEHKNWGSVEIYTTEFKKLLPDRYVDCITDNKGNIVVINLDEKTFCVYDANAKLVAKSKTYNKILEVGSSYFLAVDSGNNIKLYDYKEEEIATFCKWNKNSSLVAWGNEEFINFTHFDGKNCTNYSYSFSTKKITTDVDEDWCARCMINSRFYDC